MSATDWARRVLESRRLQLGIGALLGLVLRFVTAGDSQASHPSGPNADGIYQQIISISSAAEAENYCVNVKEGEGATISPERGQQKISDTLSDAAGWGRVGAGSGQVQFAFSGVCGNSPDANIEVRYAVSGAASQLDHLENRDYDFQTGHFEYRSALILLQYTDVDDVDDSCYPTPEVIRCAFHTVNHETGHALGLADGPPLNQPCDDYNSIMHNRPDCPLDYAWPTNDDIARVQSLIPPPGGDIGSKVGGYPWW